MALTMNKKGTVSCNGKRLLTPKHLGGLGVMDLEIFNRAL
jgi:hypothetical protein